MAPESRTLPTEPEYYYDYEDDYTTIQDINKLTKTTTEIANEVTTTTKSPIILEITDISEQNIYDPIIESELVPKVNLPSLDILRISGESLESSKQETFNLFNGHGVTSTSSGNSIVEPPNLNEYTEEYATEEEYDEDYAVEIADYEAQNADERISVLQQPQFYETQSVRTQPQWQYSQPTTDKWQRITPTTNKWQRMHLRRQSQKDIPQSKPSVPIEVEIPVNVPVSVPKPNYPPRSRDPLKKLIQSGGHRNWGSRRKSQLQTYYDITPRSNTKTKEIPKPQPQSQERPSSAEYQEIARILEQFDFESKRS